MLYLCMCINTIYIEKDRVYKKWSGLYEEIQKTRRDMMASAATGTAMKSTAAWKNLMKSYRLDVQVKNTGMLRTCIYNIIYCYY